MKRPDITVNYCGFVMSFPAGTTYDTIVDIVAAVYRARTRPR